MLGTLDVVVGFLFFLSLSAERLVTVVKTVFPWLVRDGRRNCAVDAGADRPRRLAVQGLSLAAGYLTAAVTTQTRWPSDVSKLGDFAIPLWQTALFVFGGSAFWSGVLGYIEAATSGERSLSRGHFPSLAFGRSEVVQSDEDP